MILRSNEARGISGNITKADDRSFAWIYEPMQERKRLFFIVRRANQNPLRMYSCALSVEENLNDAPSLQSSTADPPG